MTRAMGICADCAGPVLGLLSDVGNCVGCVGCVCESTAVAVANVEDNVEVEELKAPGILVNAVGKTVMKDCWAVIGSRITEVVVSIWTDVARVRRGGSVIAAKSKGGDTGTTPKFGSGMDIRVNWQVNAIQPGRGRVVTDPSKKEPIVFLNPVVSRGEGCQELWKLPTNTCVVCEDCEDCDARS